MSDFDQRMEERNNMRASSILSQMSQDASNYRQITITTKNYQQKKCLFCFTRNVKKFINNKISTSKYNVLSFLPLNLMLQFSKMANFYFLILLMMELYKPISDSNGKPVLALPLSFVVGLSMVKDIYEDILRHR